MPKYNLSDTEYALMEFIWQSDAELSFSEIMDYCSSTLKQPWKKQTVQTFLTRLIDKGALTAVRRGVKRYYSPAMSKTDFISKWTQGFLDEEYDGSLKKFMTALTGGNRLSEDEIKELHEFLDS